MDLLFKYNKEKKTRNINDSFICDISVYKTDLTINILATYELKYMSYSITRHINYYHGLTININNGDLNIINRFTTNLSNKKFFDVTHNKKNDFKMLKEFTYNGLITGQKNEKFWGVTYSRAIGKIYQILEEELKKDINSEYILKKDYKNNAVINNFFDLLVDYHLDRKNIKGHDGVYYHIMQTYPKKKWLKLNDNKFLPSILDSLSIKNGYVVSTLNKNPHLNINILSLNFFCKLFGDNYVDYLQQFDWQTHCTYEPLNKKTYTLKTEVEKRNLVKLTNSWESNVHQSHSLILSLTKLFNIREKVEKKGYNLKFKAKDDLTYIQTKQEWSNVLQYIKTGYKVKYVFDTDFVNIIESAITINDEKYYPKILKTQEEFLLEGFLMKNCIGNLFNSGVSNLFISLTNGKKTVNLQYKNGDLVNQYGKANSVVPPNFIKPIEILNERIQKRANQKWVKEKYDIIL